MGEVIFGGVGSGLYGMLVFVFVAIFIAGLMVGRTPEYLGKKIEARDVKLAALSLLVVSVFTLAGTAWASVSALGPRRASTTAARAASARSSTPSPRASDNNGSAFAGLTMTPANGNIMWNFIQGLSMLFGRLFPAIPVLALAGALVAKKATADRRRELPGHRATVRRPADVDGHHRRRADLLPGARRRAHRRALPDDLVHL